MDPNINANYLYTLISIIIFIYLYFGPSYKYKHNLNNEQILIEIDSNIIKADPTNIYNHMQILKGNLVTLNKINYKSSTLIKELILFSIIDLDSYKTANNYQDNYLETNASTHEEYGILSKKEQNHRNILKNDDNSDSEKYGLTEIILNIEIVMFLIKMHNISNSALVLTHIHMLIKEISKISNSDNYLSYDEIFGISENMTDFTSNFNNKAYASTRMGRTDNSSDKDRYSNDQMNLTYTQNLSRQKVENFDSNKMYNTQAFGNSDANDGDMRNKAKQEYVPFYNIHKLQAEYKKNKKQLVESNARQSLRNDYKF